MKLNYDSLNKNNVYCKHCFYENKIKSLDFNENFNIYEICQNHAYLQGNFRTLRFYNGEWKSIRGLKKDAKPQIQGIVHKKCNKCGFTEDSIIRLSLWQCPKCNWIPDNSLKINNHKNYKYKHVCKNIYCKNYNLEIIDNTLPQNWHCECGFKEKYFKCKKCGNDLISPFQTCSKCNFNPHSELYFCEKCGNKINQPFSKCNNCGNKKEQFIKCKQCKKLIKYNETCSCGFNVLFKHRSNLAKENLKIINHSLFEERNGILLFFDKNIGDFIPWNRYKEKFKIQNIDFQLPKEFKFYPTFRKQDSNDWTGARQAFEQNLVDNGINWFVYIKFAISSEGANIPLVVGKSGSLLVNNSGSDVSFSTDINDGPARRYLNEEKIMWNKSQIAIKNCKTEQEAFNLEKEIQKNYGLFFS